MRNSTASTWAFVAAPLCVWMFSGCSAAGDSKTGAPDGTSGSGATSDRAGGSTGSGGSSSGGDSSGSGGVIVLGDSGVTGARCGVEFHCPDGTGGMFKYPPEHLSGGAPGTGGAGTGGMMSTGGVPSTGGMTSSGGEPGTGGSGGCGQGFECKPGSVRYCDDPAAEWTQSTCDATGHWSKKCVPVKIPAAAAANGCGQKNFAPEICCGPAMICCQDNPNGPWVDGGSGACAATKCP